MEKCEIVFKLLASNCILEKPRKINHLENVLLAWKRKFLRTSLVFHSPQYSCYIISEFQDHIYAQPWALTRLV